MTISRRGVLGLGVVAAFTLLGCENAEEAEEARQEKLAYDAVERILNKDDRADYIGKTQPYRDDGHTYWFNGREEEPVFVIDKMDLRDGRANLCASFRVADKDGKLSLFEYNQVCIPTIGLTL